MESSNFSLDQEQTPQVTGERLTCVQALDFPPLVAQERTGVATRQESRECERAVPLLFIAFRYPCSRGGAAPLPRGPLHLHRVGRGAIGQGIGDVLGGFGFEFDH